MPYVLWGVFDYTYPTSKTRRGRVQEGGTVSPTITASGELYRYELQPRKGTEMIQDPKEIMQTSLTTVLKDSCAYVIDPNKITSEVQEYIFNDDGTVSAIIDGEEYIVRIRKLTPNECWRLMDFSDEQFKAAEEVNSNTQLYKQAGNSIVVSCLEQIFGELL